LSFPSNYQEFIYKRTYARWDENLGRRENWEETVSRYEECLGKKVPKNKKYEWKQACNHILSLDNMPSMRSLWSAGPALERENIAGFNCAYIEIDTVKSFAEVLYILMCGTGVGFSVERQVVVKLPSVPEKIEDVDDVIVVADSKRGWAESYLALLKGLYAGQAKKWDVSKVRPKGAKLKVFGGRACLTGDTIVYKDRKKARGYNEITIADLYKMQNSSGFWKHKPNHFKDVKIRSLDEETGLFFRNNLIEVIDNGFAPVYEILTENGYRIKATGNHRFMMADGSYSYLDNFNVNDLIAVNGSIERKTGVCLDCGIGISRRAVRCKPCCDKNQLKDDALLTSARQRKECRAAIIEHGFCESCGASECRLVVHHKDENPYNNDAENLSVLCEGCHRKHHFKQWTLGDPYSHKYVSYDKIISITYVGEENVYDLSMEGPNHNFVANGFVSHNSGPEPLVELFKFTVRTFKNAQGRRLNSLECHDLVCKVASIVVVGGVRRSACISLSNLSDDRMAHAKDGAFWDTNPQRMLANNSTAYTEKPDPERFIQEWLNLIRSKCGERGIFNRESAKFIVDQIGRRDSNYNMGTNPC